MTNSLQTLARPKLSSQPPVAVSAKFVNLLVSTCPGGLHVSNVTLVTGAPLIVVVVHLAVSKEKLNHHLVLIVVATATMITVLIT